MAYVRHMRLGFQLLLVPLFLWGVFLSGATWSWRVLVGFVALHLFLYPGATAFNSAFDRDQGPVSGLATPIAVPPRLLEYSVTLQMIGAVLAASVSAAFLAVYLGLAVVFAGYSHPGLRWKAKPLASVLAIALGQGVLGFWGGWTAAVGEYGGLGQVPALLGAGVAAFTSLGLYPSTQVFQVEEDRARGDRTLAVALGPAGALRLGALCLGTAGLLAVGVFAARGEEDAAVAVAVGYGYLAMRQLVFARTDHRETEAFHWATVTRHYAAGGFLLFLLWHLLGG